MSNVARDRSGFFILLDTYQQQSKHMVRYKMSAKRQLTLGVLFGTGIVILRFIYVFTQPTEAFREPTHINDKIQSHFLEVKGHTVTKVSEAINSDESSSTISLEDNSSYFADKDLYNLTSNDQRRFFAWRESQVSYFVLRIENLCII
jgi:hypothetical protein